MEVQSLIVQYSPRFRISGKENLKTPIQEESLNLVRPDPAPYSIRGFEEEEGNVFLMKLKRAA